MAKQESAGAEPGGLPLRLRFRRFRSRLLVLLVSLFTLLQCGAYLVVRSANRQNALAQIGTNLETGARIFARLIQQRDRQMTAAAGILAEDFGFKQAVAQDDRPTTLSALGNLAQRIDADVVQLVSLDKELLLDTKETARKGVPFPFPNLIDRAENSESLQSQAFVFLDGELYAMVATALRAPDPKAWTTVGFRITDEFAREIKSYADLEISFLASGDNGRLLASTFTNEEQRNNLLPAIANQKPALEKKTDLYLADEPFVSYILNLPTEGGLGAIVVLQRSLAKQLAPHLRLEKTMLLLAVAGLIISAALSLWLARTVSRPVGDLAEGARKIEEGDYTYRVVTKQEDEIGTLATAFNNMSHGLAERDRVRSVLGKVVSPAIAAELMGKELVLGGEERNVTVLFSDIRNFTSISERLSPTDILDTLNLYFTKMSGIIERHGGVVDKYVGDAIMALFGAPVSHPEDADAAMTAALEMCEALDVLNREWRSEGRPTLQMGIGINTDIVIAGNMGSQTRLNYTVIGDGVNVASRLEGLTKNPDYDARIIISSGTLTAAHRTYETRPLGEVAVKGKQKLTLIFALLGRKTI
ncbi:MAG: adenylate/guanylate cyclase domain-containing protein [Chthoniobacterales bacterium]